MAQKSCGLHMGGKKPYFYHIDEFARTNWPGLKDVTATASGFFFFRFQSEVAMTEIIEGGPWLFQGQPYRPPAMATRALKLAAFMTFLYVERWSMFEGYGLAIPTSLASHIITEEEARILTSPVTRTEIKQAFFDIEEDKAPGPDGYSSGFYKAAWPVIGRKMVAVEEFLLHGRLLKQVNATLLALIPKVQNPVTVADFRPISCCNVLYKAITKILVQKFDPFLADSVQPAAYAPEMCNESQPPKGIQHSRVGFSASHFTAIWVSPTFIKWIEECVTTCSFSVCLNGTIHGFFGGARGLRQGDPMSPYLFVLVMEVLRMILQQLIEQDEEFTFHWKCRDIGLFQLSFADDLLLFSSADESSVGFSTVVFRHLQVCLDFVLTLQRVN
ncbi:UNVERIFIED_CONTAM: LINE-1 reverse transcriptase [Sesamum latifolium]|uniref:LINE-1 reverse transcriptase n=1 Tax=Sesamum latifolium TaxID=2727402 RepID=A0AAW2U2A6_9LAMI